MLSEKEMHMLEMMTEALELLSNEIKDCKSKHELLVIRVESLEKKVKVLNV